MRTKSEVRSSTLAFFPMKTITWTKHQGKLYFTEFPNWHLSHKKTICSYQRGTFEKSGPTALRSFTWSRKMASLPKTGYMPNVPKRKKIFLSILKLLNWKKLLILDILLGETSESLTFTCPVQWGLEYRTRSDFGWSIVVRFSPDHSKTELS